jgi:type I restriction enzyme, S subunit
MTETEKRGPELRFKGFIDDWEQRKLEEDISVVGGATPSKSNPEYWNGSIVWLSSQEIKEKYVSKGTYTITKKAVDDNTTKMVKAGTPLIVSRSGILARLFPISIPTTDVAINQDIKALIFDPNIINTNFFVAQLQKNEDFILRSIVKTGTTVQSINMPDFYKLQLSFPSTDEQEKVGHFFQRLDDTIALHQRKLDLLNQLKQTYLHVIFPKNEENSPALRFAGFSEPWEQHKLGEIAYVVGGGTPSTSTDDYWNGNIDWYSPAEIGNQIFVKGSQKRITKAGLQKSSAKILPVGTVLFTSRAGIGKTAILAKEGATNQGFQSIVPHENELDSYFIYSRTHELKQYGETTGAGSTFIEVSGKQMVKMPILTPPLDEQTKIGFFFKQLDNNIGLQQDKLEKLLELKLVLLGKMFL